MKLFKSILSIRTLLNTEYGSHDAFKIHGYESQSKLWKKFCSKLQGIIPSAVRDCSTYKFQCTSFLKFESHNKYRLAIIILSGLFMATGCSSTGIYFYKNEKPELILENYLNGTFDAYGMFMNRSGQVTRRMHVVMKASWKGDSGELDEYFTWSDGVIQKRIWHLKKTAPGKYEGRAEDVVGIAYGEVSGNAFHWHYTLAVDVDGSIYNFNFEDWMYLMNDQILINRAEMTKFGFKVGEINITFIKRKE